MKESKRIGRRLFPTPPKLAPEGGTHGPRARETRLPGVGVKYTCSTAHGGKLTVILHNEGQRELYWFPHGNDEEPQAVIQLEDDEARQLGAIIGGAYERPKIVEELEMAFGELDRMGARPRGEPAIGKTLAECAFRQRTGITIIAILREPEPVAGAQPGDVVQQGDTLVTVGKLASTSRSASSCPRPF